MQTNLSRLVHHWVHCLMLSCSLFVAISLPAHATKPYRGTIAVVINNAQSLKKLKLKPQSLKTIFWRKQRYWPKGLPIKPVNLDTQHPLRSHFSQSILGSLPSAQIDYWNGQYFNGIRPPYSVKSEEAVLRYVAKTKGAIGYVDACKVDERIKAVLWLVNNHIQKQRPNMHCKPTQ